MPSFAGTILCCIWARACSLSGSTDKSTLSYIWFNLTYWTVDIAESLTLSVQLGHKKTTFQAVLLLIIWMSTEVCYLNENQLGLENSTLHVNLWGSTSFHWLTGCGASEATWMGTKWFTWWIVLLPETEAEWLTVLGFVVFLTGRAASLSVEDEIYDY